MTYHRPIPPEFDEVLPGIWRTPRGKYVCATCGSFNWHLDNMRDHRAIRHDPCPWCHVAFTHLGMHLWKCPDHPDREATMPSTTMRAVQYAERAHRGQRDKGGVEYIAHPIAVALAVEKYGVVATTAALLHDVVEDTPTTLVDVQREFGPEIAAVVDCLTHRPNEPYWEYIERVQTNPVAVIVKIADVEHNLSAERVMPDAERGSFLRLRYAEALDRLRGLVSAGDA